MFYFVYFQLPQWFLSTPPLSPSPAVGLLACCGPPDREISFLLGQVKNRGVDRVPLFFWFPFSFCIRNLKKETKTFFFFFFVWFRKSCSGWIVTISPPSIRSGRLLLHFSYIRRSEKKKKTDEHTHTRLQRDLASTHTQEDECSVVVLL